MNLPEVPLLSILREKMSWLNQRQAVLAQNVSNADVPGYEAKDLKPLDFAQVLKNSTQPQHIGFAVTDPRHISPVDQSSSFDETLAADTQATGSGSSVSQEQEMMKVSDTQAQYQAATNLYAKSIQMMRTAIDR
jgi:flagellar basal-body rod protein FlgB